MILTQKTKEKKMKVSKIMLASLLGVVAISGAFADEYDGPRNRCKSKSDKYWVEKTHTCVPKNTCGDFEYKDYCFKHDFKGTDTQVRLLHKKYIEQILQSTIAETLPEVESYAIGDPRHYYPYALQDGGYFVLVGDTRVDSDPEVAESMVILHMCLAYGLTPRSMPNACENVDSENKCTELANFASELTKKSCKGTLVDSSCEMKCD